ncbi:hypothetical protein GCM10022221_35850 [Actinocorallia aurea]
MRRTFPRAAAALALLTAALSPSAPASAAPEAATDLRVFLDAPPSPVDFGESVIVTGRVQFLVGGVWTAAFFEEARIRVRAGANGTADSAIKNNGEFTAQFTMYQPASLVVTATADGTAAHPADFSATSQTYSVALRPSAYLGFDALTYDADARITADYCLAAQTPHKAPAGPVYLQFSPDGRTQWSTKRTTKVNCGRLRKRWPTSGYWRLKSKADALYPSVVSEVRKAWRWRTEMSRIKVAPRKVRAGKKVTVQGRLTRYEEGGAEPFGYANRQIDIIFHCKGKQKHWRSARGRTDADGRFKIKAKTYCDSSFLAVFRGGPDTFSARSPEAKVDTTGKPLLSGRAFAVLVSVPRPR